jgi:serine/threonine-protein kinase
MAEVYKAIAPGAAGFEKTCVIKRILPEYAGDKSFVSMFVNEARIGATLAHPNIVQIYDFGEIEDEYFMSMEYIQGTDLARFLWRLLQKKRTVPGPLVAFIAVDVLRALEFAHNRTAADGKPSPVIHRDVSPQNILVSLDGLVKLADFGLARALDHARLTRPGTLKGKLSYMSPEQAFGRDMDHRTDLFSLGIVMYELLVGKSLFRAKTDAETLARVRAAAVPEFEKVCDVSPMLAKAMRRVLSREQDQRFASAAEFRRALVEYLRTITPPIEAATLGGLVREVVQGTQKPPESTAEATEMADLEALRIAEAQTGMIESGARDGESDAPPPDGPWVEGPGAGALASPGPGPTAPAKREATPAPHARAAEGPAEPAPTAPRPIPPVAPAATARGAVRVEHVVVVGSTPPAPPAPKVEVAEQATLLAAPHGMAIPVTPPHGTAALHDRATRLFAGQAADPRESSDPPPDIRDSEEKVTIMLPAAAAMPVGIVPVRRPRVATPPRAAAQPKAKATAPRHEAPAPASPRGDNPLFTMSVQAMNLEIPSEGPAEMGKMPPSVAPRPPMHGPGIVGLFLIGLGLLIMSALVTWAIVSL